jgi:hypothetical protein
MPFFVCLAWNRNTNAALPELIAIEVGRPPRYIFLTSVWAIHVSLEFRHSMLMSRAKWPGVKALKLPRISLGDGWHLRRLSLLRRWGSRVLSPPLLQDDEASSVAASCLHGSALSIKRQCWCIGRRRRMAPLLVWQRLIRLPTCRRIERATVRAELEPHWGEWPHRPIPWQKHKFMPLITAKRLKRKTICAALADQVPRQIGLHEPVVEASRRIIKGRNRVIALEVALAEEGIA